MARMEQTPLLQMDTLGPTAPQPRAPDSHHDLTQSHASQQSPPSPAIVDPATNSGMTLAQLYDALPVPATSRCIRVLDLDPPSRDAIGTVTPSALAGRLRVLNLEDKPAFTALSYVWGPKSSPLDTMILHSPLTQAAASQVTIELTTTCYGALRQIQSKFGAVTIWVDAICINQLVEDEKPTQLPLMGEIYSAATATYIWLGEGSPACDRAVDFMNRIGVVMERLPIAPMSAPKDDMDEATTAYWRAVRQDMRDRLRIIRQHPDPSISADDITELISREWITRGWTFQELILSPNPLVLCGSRLLPWDRLLACLMLARRRCFLRLPNRFFRRLDTRLAPLYGAQGTERWEAVLEFWLDFPRLKPWISNDYAKAEDVDTTPMSYRQAVKRFKETNPRSRWKGLPLWVFGFSALFFVYAIFGHLLVTFIFVPYNGEQFDNNRRLIYILVPWAVLTLLAALNVWLMVIWWVPGYEFCMYGMELQKSAPPRSPYVQEIADHWESRQTLALQTFSAIQSTLRHRRVTVAHDRSYAVFGILDKLGAAPGKADYSEGVGEAYRRLVATMVRHYPTAIALMLDAGGSKATGGPTWVPNWGAGDDLAEIYPSYWLTRRYRIGHADRLLGSFGHRGIDRPRIQDSKLMFEARWAGRVKSFAIVRFNEGRDVNGGQSADLLLKRLISWYWVFKRYVPEYTPRCDDGHYVTYLLLEGLAQAYDSSKREIDVIEAEMERRDEKEPDMKQVKHDYFELYWRMFEIIQQGLPDTEKTKSGETPDDSFIQPLLDRIHKIEGGHSRLISFVKRLATERRVLFVTSTGLPGSGPEDMQDDDEIFCLPNVQVPMVLRKVPGEDAMYTVVGAALVHGLMRLDMVPTGKRDQRFVFYGRMKDITIV